MPELQKGGNAVVATSGTIVVSLAWQATPVPLDVSCFVVGAEGKVLSDEYMVFYNQPADPSGAVAFSVPFRTAATFAVDLDRLSDGVDRCVFAATLDGPGTFGMVSGLFLAVWSDDGDEVVYCVSDLDAERALIVGELYRHASGWKLRAVGQGFSSGLKSLAESYGVEVGDAPQEPQEKATRDGRVPLPSRTAAPYAAGGTANAESEAVPTEPPPPGSPVPETEAEPEAGICVTCSGKVPFIARLLGSRRCGNCARAQAEADAAQQRAEREAAELQRLEFVFDMAEFQEPSQSPQAVEEKLRAMSVKYDLRAPETRDELLQIFASRAEVLMTDEVLSAADDRHLSELAKALDITTEEWADQLMGCFFRLQTGRANAGRLSPLRSASILLRQGEVAYEGARANLLQEVIHREYQAGSSGFSFPIARGVTYRTGSTQGRLVVTGRSLEVEDSGRLWITNQRVAFTGTRTTLEVPYSRLVRVEAFTDGLRLHASNTSEPLTFVLVLEGYAPVALASINFLAQAWIR
jgi:stress response protein SCP2